MKITYTICPNCGQKALPVATRCPGCGSPLETQFLRHTATAPKPKRIPRSLLVAGAVVTMLGVNAVAQLITRAQRQTPAATPTELAPLAEPAAAPRPRDASPIPSAVNPDTALAPVLESPSESLPPGPDTVASTVSIAPRSEDTSAVSSGERLYASTWMNVRAGRSGGAPVLRILRPGEGVQVDSLRQGWFRLVSGPEPLGYVDRRLLDSSPPSVSP